MKRSFLIKLLLCMGFFLYVGSEGLYSQGGLLDIFKEKEKTNEKKNDKKKKSGKNKKEASVTLIKQRNQYKEKIKKLSKEYDQLRTEYWSNKQIRNEEKNQALDRLENIKESSSTLYEDKNSLVQELLLDKRRVKSHARKKKSD